MSGLVRTARGAGFTHVELCEPARRNPLSTRMLGEVRDALDAHAGTNAVILSGADGVFSAGADLRELEGTAADRAIDDAIAATVERVRRAGALTIAAVEGACVGAAVDLALACHLIVAGEGATFAVPAARLGILYNPDAVARWHARLPRATVVRLLLVGEWMDAATARDGGVVTEVVSAGAAVARATEIAGALADLDRRVVEATTGVLADLDGGVGLGRWEDARRELLTSTARREALHRARERR
ncbi:MAG: enoyl-CoA hydratase/isomerase family protein [Streptosporangiales bacterium]|nr:enoyl-CoA hydratase/isomerase family protein [Streptosporangiales bacterium]